MRRKRERRIGARVLGIAISAALALSSFPAVGVQGARAADATGDKPGVSAKSDEVDGEVTASGTFGGEKDSTGAELSPDTHQWSYAAGTGVLTISGEGAIPDYTSSTYSGVPWYTYKDGIKKIVFTGKVTAVGAYTFYGYSKVEEVDFGGAEDLDTIGEAAFRNTTVLEKMTGTEGIVTLGKNCFYYSGLKSLAMPSVEAVPEAAFRQCNSLVSIDFQNATTFGKDAFYQCEKLTDVAAPKVETLADNVFQKCYALEHIELPELLTISSGFVFFECSKLKTVSFPKLASITGNSTFRNCVSLQSIDFPELTVMKNVTTFAQNCTSLVSVNLPKADIKFTESNNMFDGCNSLVYADFSSVTSLAVSSNTSIFKNTYNLRRLYIGGEKLTAQVKTAFYGKISTKQKNVIIYISTASEDNWEYLSDSGTVRKVAVEDVAAVKAKETPLQLSQEDYDAETPAEPKVTGNAEGAELTYRYCTDLACQTPVDSGNPGQKPTVPGVYYVQATAGAVGEDSFETSSYPVQFTVYGEKEGEGFSYHNKTHTLTIKNASVMAQDYADKTNTPWKDYYAEVEKVVVQEGVTLTRIAANAFNYMRNMKEFALPDTVTEIGEKAFYYCSSWEGEDVLTENVTSIGANAFDYCIKLTGTMTFNPSITEIPERVLYCCEKVTKIQYSDNVTSFGKSCFGGTGVTELKIPPNMTELPEDFFYNCENVTSVEFPEGVTKIPNYFLYGCKSITQIDIPETVTEIGNYAFAGMGLSSIILPAGIQTIGKGAFSSLEKLENFEIPRSLTVLPESLLSYSGVKRIFIPSTVVEMGGNIFQRCEKLEYLEYESDNYTADTLALSSFWKVPETAMIICDGSTYETLKSYEVTTGLNAWFADAILYKRSKLLADMGSDFAATKKTATDYGESLLKEWNEILAQAYEELFQAGTTYEKMINWKDAKNKIAIAGKTILQDTYRKVTDILESDYDIDGDGADAWFAYRDELDQTKDVLKNNDAALDEILEADENLRKAFGKLVPMPADEVKAEVDKLIKEVEAMKAADYTAESWAALQDAVKEAQEICQNGGTISQITAAKKKVEEAKDALVKAPADPAATPSGDPGTQPSKAPDKDPDDQPGTSPSKDPDIQPTTAPSADPGNQPTQKPGVEPTKAPGAQPTQNPGKVTPKPKKVTVKKVSLKKAKAGKKTITVQWKKVAGVSGYQVQIGTNKKVTKGKKTYTVKKAKTVKKTIKKLKRKKTYYVRVRAYKTVEGKKYYGKWCKVKKVKVK